MAAGSENVSDRALHVPRAEDHDDETTDATENSEVEEDDEDEDDEEDEPKLKYARMTSHLLPVYRNGDATSAFLMAGDKMVCRTALHLPIWLNSDSLLVLITATW